MFSFGQIILITKILQTCLYVVVAFLLNIVYNMFMIAYGKYIYTQTTDLNYKDILHFVSNFSVLETDVCCENDW